MYRCTVLATKKKKTIIPEEKYAEDENKFFVNKK